MNNPHVHSENRAIERPLPELLKGIFFAQIRDETNPVFNTGLYVELHGELDVPAFRSAYRKLMAEAETLSLRLHKGPEISIDRSPDASLIEYDFSNHENPTGAAIAHIQADIKRPRKLFSEQLSNQHLYRISENTHFWYFQAHHIVVDGFATQMILERMAALYCEQKNEEKTVGTQFQPFTNLEAENAYYWKSDKCEKDRQYWRDALAVHTEIRGLKAGLAVSDSYYHHCEVKLPDLFCEQVLALSKQSAILWPDCLTTLTASYCARFLLSDSIVVGVPFMGRLGSNAAKIPAMVMNILPVPLKIDEKASLEETLSECSRIISSSRRHGGYRCEHIRRDQEISGDEDRLHGPVINVIPFDSDLKFSELNACVRKLCTGPVDDLDINFRSAPSGRNLVLEINANPKLYSFEEVEAHAKRLEIFLTNAVSSERLLEVQTVSLQEREEILYRVNDTHHDVEQTTLIDLFLKQVSSTPDNTAVSFNGDSLTYRDLAERAETLKQTIKDHYNVCRGDIVAVALPRSIELSIALLAIQMAGAAYLPVDPTQPQKRNDRILNSAQPKLIISKDQIASANQCSVFSFCDHKQYAPQKTEKNVTPHNAAKPFDTAYVIYTSGSTGEPKGVVVEHDAIVNRLLWMIDMYGFNTSDCILQKTPTTFDVSVWELFAPLLCGATLVYAEPEAHKEPKRIIEIIHQENISILHFVPSMLAAFLAEPTATDLLLRCVFCSGEALPDSLRDQFHAKINAELHNLYGPTEAAVDVSYWPALKTDNSKPVPIGMPVWNTRMYALDNENRLLPHNVDGKLYLAGRQLAAGYLENPTLTAEKFVPDPFFPNERMYDTGDLACLRPEGYFEYIGRSDFQVKIRGQRVELGEIEAALGKSELVSQAAVIAKKTDNADIRIIAYIVPKEEFASDLLREQLARILPIHMIPSAIVEMEFLPTTSSGKLDRKTLPEPIVKPSSSRMPETSMEKLLCKLYTKLLGFPDNIGVDDDFFLLGGHSLLAVELALEIENEVGTDPGIGAVFACRTPAKLAKVIEQPTAMADTLGLRSIMPLSEVTNSEAPLFMIHPAGGLSWCYNNLAMKLRHKRNIYALQAPCLDLNEPEPNSMGALAEAYADTIINALHGASLCHLLGWSVGGIIGQAIAVELQKRGYDCGVVAMLDSYPCDVWRNEPEPEDGAQYKALLAIAGYDTDEFEGKIKFNHEEVFDFLKRSKSPLASLSDRALRGVTRVVGMNNRLVRSHHHSAYHGTITHFRASHDHLDGRLRPELWNEYTTKVSITDVPVTHGYMLGESALQRIIPVLDERLSTAEASKVKQLCN